MHKNIFILFLCTIIFLCQLTTADAKKKKEKDLTPTMRKSLKIDARGHAVIDEQYENLLPDGEVTKDNDAQEATSKSEEAYEQLINELFNEDNSQPQQEKEVTTQDESENITPPSKELESQTAPVEEPEEKQGLISSFKEKIQKSKEERQKEVKINAKGKVNWRKTINSQKIFYKNKIIYNDIYVNKTNYFAEKEIQEIQKYCLSKISEMIGFMWDFSFSYFNIDYSKAEMIKLLKQELKETNQDIKIEILNNLIDFIIKTNFEKLKKGNVFIKYKEFQYIWEELVDNIGIKGEEKKEYFPKARYYYLEGQEYKSNIKLQFPDTIVNRENLKYIYVLDAKYYPEGSLPEEYSIFKQIRYGQHVNEIKQKEGTRNTQPNLIHTKNL